MAQKIYLLDTNVLIYNPHALFSFGSAMVGIPAVILEELDVFKREPSDRGRSAREVIRILDSLRAAGSLKDGVPLETGGTLRVVFLQEGSIPHLPFKIATNDNEILLTAFFLKQQNFEVHLISKDLNVRIKADALNIIAEDYLTQNLTPESFYRGWQRLEVPAVQLKKEVPDAVNDLISAGSLQRNEFIIVESQHNAYNYRLMRYCGGSKVINVQEPALKWPLKARNAQQLMALNLLLDPDIQLITLFGPAGTGKTFLALLAGLHSVLVTDEFKKLLIARPVIPLGRDVGYLPGTLQEKLYSWMLPVYDNMELILHNAAIGSHRKSLEDMGDNQHHRRQHHEQRHDQHRKKRGKFDDRRRGGNGRQDYGGHRADKMGLKPLDYLIEDEKISLEAITYMRGRSIPYQFILIDEVQNLTPHEVKTIVSRVGEGSKLVLAGDPYQIDSPYLDFSSNGLVVVNEKFKGQALFGSVYLEISERSALSQLAIDLL
ncbi:MAG TPA: PhoH family protein [Candidatus Babeliales bacterium]|nr:PhoH family protein [Candidatus Babeliales bacterium]